MAEYRYYDYEVERLTRGELWSAAEKGMLKRRADDGWRLAAVVGAEHGNAYYWERDQFYKAAMEMQVVRPTDNLSFFMGVADVVGRV